MGPAEEVHVLWEQAGWPEGRGGGCLYGGVLNLSTSSMWRMWGYSCLAGTKGGERELVKASLRFLNGSCPAMLCLSPQRSSLGLN